MKIMVAFLGKKRNKRNEYLEKAINIHKEKIKIKSNNILKRNSILNGKLKNTFKNNNKDKNKNNKRSREYIKSLNNEKENTKWNFFESKNKINFSIKNSMLSIAICFVIFLVINHFPFLKINFAKLCFVNRQAENNINVASSFLSSYQIFNKQNYILSKEESNNNKDVEKQKSEDENTSTSNEENINYNDEYKLLDKDISKNITEEVFSNKDINVNITAENATYQKITVNNNWIINYSSNRNIDFKNIMNRNINLTKASDRVLLYNTHTSESYTNSDKYKFEYSSVMRSLDARYNMLAIASELNKNLNQKGISSSHNTTPHDYGAYTGAYTKSRLTVQNDLKNNGRAGIIIDVHRDAMEDLTFRPVANINGVQVAQVMFVIGIGDNPYWEDNLCLALKIQEMANKVYPGLFRQMIIRDSTYNQDLNKYAELMEFGATGNTIDEVKLTTRCVANLLNIIYKD